MVREIPSSTVANRDEECLKKSLMEVVKSDSSNICRLCLSKDQKLTRAFVDERGLDDALLKKIFDCTTVKVKLKGIFPSAICAVCDLKLNEYYRFREQCIENDHFLHSLLDDRMPPEVDQSVPIVTEPWQKTASEAAFLGLESAHGKDSQAEQQAATSTTSTSEAQKDNGKDMMAIALDQLSSFGLRPLKELMMPAEPPSLLGEVSAAAVVSAVAAAATGRNIVSSSSAPSSQQRDAPAPSLLSSIELAVAQTQKRQMEQQERTFALAALEMAGLQAANESGGNGPAGVANGTIVGGKYECGVCHRMFRNAYTLRRHTNLHTETNLFPCEYCGKKFNDRSNWKIHQRTHTGDNLYTCLVCLKTFISPSTLKYHRRSHRRLESFDCRLCPGTFDSYDLLEEHARRTHQDMQDFQSDDPFMDATNFVKIELEDGELSRSTPVEGVSTTRVHGVVQHAPDGDEDDDDDEDRERRTVDSSCGQNELQQQVEQHRRQQQLLQLMQQQLHDSGVIAEIGPKMHGEQDEIRIKQEMLDGGGHATQPPSDVEVKEEPPDDAQEIDPSELLQQAMEEVVNNDTAVATDNDKQLSSSSCSSSSSPTVILFRCDYCMKIFQFLDDLNAHMLLHNATKCGTGITNDAMATMPATNTMPLLALVRPTPDDPSLSLFPTTAPIPSPVTATGGDSPRKPKRRPAIRPLKPPSQMISDMVGPLPSSPPEYPCTKCPKKFRTEDLRRVHEAMHANDDQVNKVRSCRICNKLFKCELNLLAHMRKHALMVDQGQRPPSDGEPVGDSSSGNDESCSSSSTGGGLVVAAGSQPLSSAHSQHHHHHHHHLLHQQLPSDESDETESVSPKRRLAPAPVISVAGTPRTCEICAITIDDALEHEQHMMCHFQRKEAIAFVPQTDRPFQCTECHKSFKRKDYLLIHIRTHTGERRYKCDLCSSAFVHPSNLITHRKLHSSERPHRCQLCGATFKLFAGLKIHRRRCEQKLPKGWPDGRSPGLRAILPAIRTSYPF